MDLGPDQCKAMMRKQCVGGNQSAAPAAWDRFAMYNIPGGGEHASPQDFTDYTAEFLLTRGPYAMLGYSWCGCTNGQQMRPRATEWDKDFGEPVGVCKETGTEGVLARKWTKGSVE